MGESNIYDPPPYQILYIIMVVKNSTQLGAVNYLLRTTSSNCSILSVSFLIAAIATTARPS